MEDLCQPRKINYKTELPVRPLGTKRSPELETQLASMRSREISWAYGNKRAIISLSNNKIISSKFWGLVEKQPKEPEEQLKQWTKLILQVIQEILNQVLNITSPQEQKLTNLNRRCQAYRTSSFTDT